jgi:uncharacterized protein DUF397
VVVSERHINSNGAASGGLAGAAEFAQAPWRKSSWSAYNGNCVEVADLGDRLIGVRDTKDVGFGPVLVFGNAAWRSFLDGVKNGD